MHSKVTFEQFLHGPNSPYSMSRVGEILDLVAPDAIPRLKSRIETKRLTSHYVVVSTIHHSKNSRMYDS